MPAMGDFVSRAGLKLDHAILTFGIDCAGKICADFGSNVGGFVDCLLQRGAARVYAIDAGYGQLDWKLRNDPRVVVMERTNAMHVVLPQVMSLVTIDVAWTRQRNILPAARRLIASSGRVISLVKPHYEVQRRALRGGVLDESAIPRVMRDLEADIAAAGFAILGQTPSPIRGQAGNAEVLLWLGPRER
jgi:23S rRNA (cytidine1920-2'-O)/16S rRNA (cytidine1409-2'-O)-methyltransferase